MSGHASLETQRQIGFRKAESAQGVWIRPCHFGTLTGNGVALVEAARTRGPQVSQTLNNLQRVGSRFSWSHGKVTFRNFPRQTFAAVAPYNRWQLDRRWMRRGDEVPSEFQRLGE